ncbi:MAG: hypothetical protein ABI703_10740 [Gemmatimonadales bacterium]
MPWGGPAAADPLPIAGFARPQLRAQLAQFEADVVNVGSRAI